MAAKIRTIEEIVQHYAKDLLKKNLISAKDYEYHTTNKEGKSEILELLMERLYDRETINGQEVSTVSAFYHFCEYVLHKDPASGQRIWNPFLKILFISIERHQLTSILAPRGHGKSFFASALYPLFKAYLYPYFDAVLVSNIPSMTKRNFRVLKRLIESNALLNKKIDYVGNEKKKWTETEISYNNGYIEGISIGSSPRSAHVKYVVGDDPLRDDSKYSVAYYKNFFLAQLLPIIQRYKGRMVVVGTPMHFEDLFHTIMNTKIDGDEKVPIPVGELIRDGKMSCLGFYSIAFKSYDEETGEILLPQVFSKRQLDLIRKTQGEIFFQREYMCECVADKTAVFPWNLIKKCMKNSEEIQERGTEYGDYFMGVDVATSGSASADYSAYIVLEGKYMPVTTVDDDGNEKTEDKFVKVLRYVDHIKGMAVDEQIKRIENLSRRFNDAYTLVEKNNVGVAFTQKLRYNGVNIGEFVTSRFKKENAIRLLVSDMKQGKFLMPKKGKNIQKLKDELTKFGVKMVRTRAGSSERMQALSGHDDLVMALVIANQAVEEMGTGSSTIICQD